MELKLAQVLDFLLSRLLAFDYSLSGRVLLDESFVDGIQDSCLDVVMEVHRRLSFMGLGVLVDDFLVLKSVEFLQLQLRSNLFHPGKRQPVLLHRHFGDGTFLIDTDPAFEVVTEFRIRRERLVISNDFSLPPRILFPEQDER